MKFFIDANFVISLIFTVCYSYQIIYTIIACFIKPKKFPDAPLHRFAILVAARNEKNVISQLIDSAKNQKYPSDMYDIYIVADNCTDNTAEIARNAGAIVFERSDTVNVGKGFALDFLFQKIFEEKGNEYYDGYFIFDADNLLDENYIYEMNKVFSSGYEIITSYRNSKNYDSSWVSAGYSLGFLRDAKFLHNARMIVNSGSVISGTGFLVKNTIINEHGGWKFFTLTEDCEFSIKNIIDGHKVGYCHDAIFYDEQPVDFMTSVRQRLRWVKGTFIVFGKYGKKLFTSLFKKGGFTIFDVIMTSFPAMLLSTMSLIVCIAGIIFAIVTGNPRLDEVLEILISTIASSYMMLFAMGLLTGITERKRIKCRKWKKILYYFTFPIFLLSYIPICLIAPFKKVKWKPIEHSVNVSVDDVKKEDKELTSDIKR